MARKSEVEKKKCSHCKANNRLTAKKCYNCGRPLPTEEEYREQKAQEAKGTIGCIVVAIIVFVIIGLIQDAFK